MNPPDITSVLFVCLGNICRSPLAEGVFAHLVAEAALDDRFRIDSAGTGAWHVGNLPDPRPTPRRQKPRKLKALKNPNGWSVKSRV